MTSENAEGAEMTATTPWLDLTKGWIAENKGKLSSEGVDLASAVSEAGHGSVTVYAQTQSPDLYDENAATEGFVELTARLTVLADGAVEIEILEADSGETIESRKERPDEETALHELLDGFVQTLKSRSFGPAGS
jgi:hypothetical protein